MIKPVIRWPDSRLTKISEPVGYEQFGSPWLAALIVDLWETLEANDGVGISAVQIGEPVRCAIITTMRNPLVLINPVVIAEEGDQVTVEGCLSIPQVFARVRRPLHVTIRNYAPGGRASTQKLGGIEAVCASHEIDHFLGKLFWDRLTLARRNELKAQAEKSVCMQTAGVE